MEPSPTSTSGKLLGFVLFLAVAANPPQAMLWDGIGFLEWARPPLQLDYGHLFYVPLLRAWHALLWPITGSEEYDAKVLSTVGAATCFLLLWTRAERRGLSPAAAITVAVLVATTPLFWSQATVIEPTTWTMCALLATAAAAERYGAERTLLRACLLCGAATLLLGFHLVSVFALPWIATLARGPAPRPPARHLLVPAGFALAFLALAAGADKLVEVGTFTSYWRGFLPRVSAESLAAHASKAGEALAFGYPLVSALGACALVGYAVKRRRLPAAALLAATYLLAFLFLGKPEVGLLVPVSVGLGLVLTEGLAALPRGRLARALAGVVLPLVVAIQVGDGLVRALGAAATPDGEQEKAELLAGALPPGSILLAGPVAHHLRWFTGAPFVALPNEIHSGEPGPNGEKNAVEIVRRVAAREAEVWDTVYITNEALEYLQWRFHEDPAGIEVDESRRILVNANPLLTIVPVVTRPPRTNGGNGANAPNAPGGELPPH